MPETDEENHSNTNSILRQSPATEELPITMTMDLDLDGSWTFDQIFSTDPLPSFTFSASDQPFSPLWAFSDDNNNANDGESKPVGNVTLTSSGAALRILSSNPDQAIRKPSSIDEKRRLSLPVFGVNPSDYQDATCVIKERMTLALRYFKKELCEQHILAQVWAPVKNGGRYVLTTCGQPFVLGPNCTSLHQYRMASLTYMFSIDGETDEVLGLPGRVFRQKLPEWTPNVQYYSDKEYPRLNHALNYDVRGTLALPVFEPSGQSCVGVLELILTSQKINYAPEVDKVCKALEAVNLKSSDILDHPNTQASNL